ncbi:hypothetical protein JHW43_007418 [Diplocarpon mali]|nr:hypothetical protein JHW43_007418 [Diplocarpon mali]
MSSITTSAGLDARTDPFTDSPLKADTAKETILSRAYRQIRIAQVNVSIKTHGSHTDSSNARFEDVISGPASNQDPELSCNICFEPIQKKGTISHWWEDDERGIQTVCAHDFHGSCLWEWFGSAHRPTCPMCRKEFTITHHPQTPVLDLRGWQHELRTHNAHIEDIEDFHLIFDSIYQIELHPSFLLHIIIELMNNVYLSEVTSQTEPAKLADFLERVRIVMRSEAMRNSIHYVPEYMQEVFGDVPYAAADLLDCSDATIDYALRTAHNALLEALMSRGYDEYVRRFVESESELLSSYCQLAARNPADPSVEGTPDAKYIQYEEHSSPGPRIESGARIMNYSIFDSADAKFLFLKRAERFASRLETLKEITCAKIYLDESYDLVYERAFLIKALESMPKLEGRRYRPRWTSLTLEKYLHGAKVNRPQRATVKSVIGSIPVNLEPFYRRALSHDSDLYAEVISEAIDRIRSWPLTVSPVLAPKIIAFVAIEFAGAKRRSLTCCITKSCSTRVIPASTESA